MTRDGYNNHSMLRHLLLPLSLKLYLNEMFKAIQNYLEAV